MRAGTTGLTDPFHDGERRLQALAGVRARMAEVGARVIRAEMPDPHRQFFAQLPFVVVASLDGQGRPWASLLCGAPGFVRSPQPDRLEFSTLPLAGSPLAECLGENAPIGLLGIEAHTRRRNRVNGWVRLPGANDRDATWGIGVEHSFGNCPKYIVPRQAVWAPERLGSPQVQEGEALDDAARALLERSDTLFIASAHPHTGAADVSHRGGPPGFVRVIDAHTLWLPDYPGNFFFNTLGNLLIHPFAGLLCVDPDRADALHVQVAAALVPAPGHDTPERRAAARPTALAGEAAIARGLALRVLRTRWLRGALPLRWCDAA